MSENFDVLVVGAGAAGLAAAQALAGAKLKICVLEARNRVGGRINTLLNPSSPLPIELGAEFIHGHPKEIWNTLTPFGLTACELSSGEDSTFWQELAQLMKNLRRAPAPDRSFQEFLESIPMTLPRAFVERVIAFVEGFHAADSSKISEHALASMMSDLESGEGFRVHRITGGYSRFAWKMLQNIPGAEDCIHLSTEVTEIRWKRDSVEALATIPWSARNGSFNARKAVITLPVGVLKAGSVRFSPSLTARMPLLKRIESGYVIKIVLQFRQEFWESTLPDFGFIHSPDNAFPTWWSTSPLRTPFLTGWVGGPRAQELLERSEPEILDAALRSLSRVLKTPLNEVQSSLMTWYFHDWQSDPYSLGAYSYLAKDGIPAQAKLSEPVEDTLYFAGEALDLAQIGTVHGAIASGQRAARTLLSSFRAGTA